MREIKFRGKRVDNGEWVYGYYFKGAYKSPIGNITTNHYIISEEACVWSCHNKISIFDTQNHVVDFVEVIPESVGQFTGLKDKNGVELYYDDLVNIQTKDNPYQVVQDDFGVPCFVSPQNFIHCIDFVDYFSKMSKTDFEIIGNIYENPELLEDSHEKA